MRVTSGSSGARARIGRNPAVAALRMIVLGLLGPIEDVLTNDPRVAARVGRADMGVGDRRADGRRPDRDPAADDQADPFDAAAAEYAPELKALQQKYKNDKQRMNEEVMKFYRENKVNPAASCLPIILQIPIFISLFWVLRDFEKEVFPRYPSSELGFSTTSFRTSPSTSTSTGPAGSCSSSTSRASSSRSCSRRPPCSRRGSGTCCSRCPSSSSRSSSASRSV